MAQVRVANMQGLVYKNGQAGVTKASVTIVFDNNAPGGPLGYDQHKQITVTRQVVIGGRNKYLINGRVAQQKQVQDLFHSVQLNVNNPHFLIMQGRITKVLNMNPDETLGLVEEAAGTRMYEDRKAASQRRMRKKDDKVKEIVRVLLEASPVVEVTSIDDVLVDLTGTARLHGAAWDVAVRLRAEVLARTRMPVTLGLGTNRTMARLAGKLAKPGGVAELLPGHERAFLACTGPRDREVPGLGSFLARLGFPSAPFARLLLVDSPFRTNSNVFEDRERSRFRKRANFSFSLASFAPIVSFSCASTANASRASFSAAAATFFPSSAASFASFKSSN